MRNLFIKQLSDETLMGRVKEQSDTPAFEELYARYSKRLLIYFLRMLGGDEAKSQDFLQDLFLKIIEKRYQYQDGARFSSWLYTIAGNMCKNEYRSQQVRRIVERSENPDTFAAETPHREIHSELDQHSLRNRVLQKLEKFDFHQRSAFLLRYQEQLSIREISAIMNCAEGTTKSRLFYVTRKLGKAFQSWHPNKNEVKTNDA
ncbi:MAG: sigma-70 family RNA polymerase sigma factor [Calditrichota bacterium]